jgi:hypothetical protein
VNSLLVRETFTAATFVMFEMICRMSTIRNVCVGLSVMCYRPPVTTGKDGLNRDNRLAQGGLTRRSMAVLNTD